MANIPPHYTDRFIIQRYNKALHFVQHLPAKSKFQPTKDQKLELYALYKQVSEGDINVQRPGLFDVVGRAKWDAWKKLEGLSVLEARHIYVEALLRIAAEAYKRNAGREEAQQIIHAFAIMRPAGDDDSDDIDTDDTSNQDDDEDMSIASEEAEERAYLNDIQENRDISFSLNSAPMYENNRRMQPSPLPPRNSSLTPQQGHRPPSVASVQSMVTAPTTPRQLPTAIVPKPASISSLSKRPRSAVSSRLGQIRGNEKRSHMIRDSVTNREFNEEFDDSVNPWAHHPGSITKSEIRHQRNRSTSDDSIENRLPIDRARKSSNSSNLRPPVPIFQRQQQQRLANSITSPSPPLYPSSQSMAHYNTLQSPIHNSSESSSVTATQSNLHNSEGRAYVDNRHIPSPFSDNHTVRPINDQNYSTSSALGPATKRALESLQNEIIALNERIDDLRKELVERDKKRSVKPTSLVEPDDDIGDSWKWVFKAALKYAGVNLLTALILFLFLYKNGSPIAYAILKQSGRFWKTFKLKVLISNTVV
ncbi:acyl CoA binding protein-domain-containing protein [Pilobolus umbonatus]|nr:acyl CoA binding protein-domain-containing protein [Pilobolus umbonatus]